MPLSPTLPILQIENVVTSPIIQQMLNITVQHSILDSDMIFLNNYIFH